MPEMHINTEEDEEGEERNFNHNDNTAMTMISSNNLGDRNPVEYATYENRAMAKTPSPVIEREKPQESCI